MIGDNLGAIVTADDARAYAAAIAALRAEAECIEATYRPHLDALAGETKTYRTERDGKTAPLSERAAALRKVLADWLAGDPDGNLRDGERIVATLSRKPAKPQIHADQLPPEFFHLTPDHGKINAALARGEAVPGVSVPMATILRVL